MPHARKRLINLNATHYYHCIARCVRRAFLCGDCHLTGRNYEYRKHWVVERLARLSNIFAIEIAAYSVMSNHYHLILKVNPDDVLEWTEDEIVSRWQALFSIPPVIKMSKTPNASPAIKLRAQELINTWKNRLCDISWFMRCLNEYLARKANQDDNCTGRFWEGRFKSQALLDEAAIFAAMAYTDLNPIRSGTAKNLEDSEHTSIQQRISERANCQNQKTVKLMKLSGFKNHNNNIPTSVSALPITIDDYIAFVSWSGQVIRSDTRGNISPRVSSIVAQLNFRVEGLINLLKRRDGMSGLSVIGSPKSIVNWVQQAGNSFVRTVSLSQQLYHTP